jgi:delta24(24(1))-sterol reductase
MANLQKHTMDGINQTRPRTNQRAAAHTEKCLVEKKADMNAPLVDGWRTGTDPKIDQSGELEFGGPLGTTCMMVFFPLLMWYMWIGAIYYHGNVPVRSPGQSWSRFALELLALLYEGGFPHVKAWFWYWTYLVFEATCYCLLPGVWAYGKPLLHENGKQLPYYCNAYASLYFTLAMVGLLHFTGIWPIYTVLDEFGPLLSVSILSAFLVSTIAYFSAHWRGKQHRMTGSFLYDFWMGAELNPRLFGILDLKMFLMVRMPWFVLLILSLGAAARQWEEYGYVSAEVMFIVMAHHLYAHSCSKGEELIVTTWYDTTPGLILNWTYINLSKGHIL